MSTEKRKRVEITPVANWELPIEFKRLDKPLGLEQHHMNFLFCGVLTHSCFFYYLFYLFPFGYVPRYSLLLGMACVEIAGLGITVGCHRYWTHRTFKATMPLQILLMVLQTVAIQYPIFKWCRDHRVHHKFTDTDADPHNSKRGFWFSHMGWLFEPKHPELTRRLESVDISDLASDPLVRFQSKYYWELVFVLAFIAPMGICSWLFPEMSLIHLFVWNLMRYCMQLNITFLVNSVAHIWGDKPYDQQNSSTDSKWVSFLANGEGWHNYHHTFPWDYKAAELGWKYNLSTMFIDFFAWVGWAYDLKTVSQKLLQERINRTGDISHPLHKGHHHHNKLKTDINEIEKFEKCIDKKTHNKKNMLEIASLSKSKLLLESKLESSPVFDILDGGSTLILSTPVLKASRL